jgi:hypothetical protein
MSSAKRKLTAISVVALLAASLGSTNAISQNHDEESMHPAEPPAVSAIIAGEFFDVTAHVSFERAVIRVSGPKGYSATIQIPAGTSTITADLILDASPAPFEDLDLRAYASDTDGKWHTLPDGEYHYEIVMISGDRIIGGKSGVFRVESGIASDDVDYNSHSNAHAPNLFQRIAGAALHLLVPSANAQNTFPSLIVLDDHDNSNQSWVSYDNESHAANWRVGHINGYFRFYRGGFGTLSAHVMTVRDASGTSRIGLGTSVPSEQVHLVSNDGISAIRMENNTTSYEVYTGASSGFRINQTQPVSRVPLWIEPGALTDSLRIDSSGNVGLGTSTPIDRLQVMGGVTVSSNIPKITWDNLNGPNFDIGELNDNLYFRAEGQPASITMFSSGRIAFGGSSVTVRETSGRVGIGTTNPAEKLHVRATNGTAKILLQETQAIATNTMFTMQHNGNPGFRMENTSSGAEWDFRLGGSGSTEQFTINKTANAGPELSVLQNGNIRIKGNYLNGSSRAIKHGIRELDGAKVLDQLDILTINEWRYNASPEHVHAGPMAEDFYEVFGLGVDETSLALTDIPGIALAAIKELNARNAQLKERVEKLEALILLTTPVAQR